MAKKHWMQDLHLHKGALRMSLHVPSGRVIPEGKLKKAAHSKNKKTAARARLAEVFKHSRKKGRK